MKTITVVDVLNMYCAWGVYVYAEGRLEAVREGVRLDSTKVCVISIMLCLYAGGADNQPQ